MTDDERLRELIEIWYACAGDAAALLRELPDEAWELPTDLPGWDVRAVACHLAHLESELAGNPQEQVEVPDAPHVRGLMGQFTEAGPLARASWSRDEIIEELERSVEARYAAMDADPPTDASAPGPGFAGLIGWSWQTLLSNRPFDIWMHEQDIRRATGRPGHLDTPRRRARRSGCSPGRSATCSASAPRRPAGSSLVVELTDVPHEGTRALAVEVGEDGRGRPLPGPPTDPTVRLRMDLETFVVLSGGRRTPDQVGVEAEGDQDLAERVLAAMAVTP